MDLYEHQARQLFEEYGIVVPRAEVTDSSKKAREIARRFGGRVVVKAQVKTGGRGRAGGVKLAADPAATELTARQILGMDIKGHRVRTVMVAEPVDTAEEFRVSYALDRSTGGFLAIASARGGTETEEAGASRPEAVARVPVDPTEGVTSSKAAGIAAAAGLPPQAVDTLVRLWRVLVREDALLVEVDPLVRTRQGRIVALGGRITLDRNARFRQARWGVEHTEHDDPLEAAAAARGLTCVKLDGEVGVIGNGAGLVMSTLDMVADRGARPANFLDIGGGASARRMADGLSVVLSDPSVRSVLVNVFGGITACDTVAEGIVQALDTVRLTRPLVVRLDGNNAARGRAILDERAHPLLEQAATMDTAASRAAEPARGA
ncbi:ADP-forming succinate--CoA ligase subunit beta [Streptomyces sp. 6-11-2]|uniref:ADP-forming succinate--CoA ligase subunit beta n=1 Tax=Streptomyces sp. 6-11-2 TaxID=2585753 RepID=UPI001142A12F|nr:ADP-forming succinate--CoA ligase subunit beta [Streptomyces sp. 6-11-2]GED83746.1 succinate--CoA ligase [ADP-forming] subunit beta 2 [Streptomyces sp. 6-11-2]